MTRQDNYQKLKQANLALQKRVMELEKENARLANNSAPSKNQETKSIDESRYRVVVETISYGITEIDKSGIILFANPAYHQMLGYNDGELVGKSVVNIKATEDLRESIQNYLGMIFKEQPTPKHYITQNITKKGRLIDVQVDWAYQYDNHHKVVGLISIITDITEKKKAETALKASEAKYQDLYDNAPDMFVSIDAKTTNIIECNKTVLEKLGFTKQELIGQPISIVYPPEKWDWIQKNVFGIFKKTGQINNADLELLKKDGSRMDVILNASAVRDSQGNIIYSRSIWRDVTERKRLKEQLLAAQKMESLGTMASGISHDFNNILSSVIGFTEIALYDQLPKDTPARYPLEQVLVASKRAKDVIKQILTFSRSQKVDKDPLNFVIIMKESLKLLQASCPDNITIKEIIHPDPLLVVASPSLLQQLQLNLYTNAIQAMNEDGGLLDVSLSTVKIERDELVDSSALPSGIYAKLRVKDTGHGIEPIIIDRIFDPYFTTKHKEDGTGLGLSMVHSIVDELKGQITVNSSLNQGTTFTVLLPTVMEKNQVQSSGRPPVVLGQGEKILLVEDDIKLLYSYEYALKSLGYSVLAESNALQALDIFKTHPNDFNLVISDQSMPLMTGDQLAEEIINIRKDIPIIICTGHQEFVEFDKLKSLGIEIIATKPLFRENLSQLVQQALTKMKKD